MVWSVCTAGERTISLSPILQHILYINTGFIFYMMEKGVPNVTARVRLTNCVSVCVNVCVWGGVRVCV